MSKVKKVSQALIVHGLAKGCSLGANFLSLSKAPPADPADPALEPQEFTSLLASYKLKGITKVNPRPLNTTPPPPINFGQGSEKKKEIGYNVCFTFFSG